MTYLMFSCVYTLCTFNSAGEGLADIGQPHLVDES